jgi:hypothetical protein
MANVTFSTLTFYEAITEPTGDNYVLMVEGIKERVVRRAVVDHEFMGLNGVESVDGGSRPRVFDLTGQILAASEKGIYSGINAILAVQTGSTGTLTRYGESLTNCELVEFEPGGLSTGRLLHMPLRVTFRKL